MFFGMFETCRWHPINFFFLRTPLFTKGGAYATGTTPLYNDPRQVYSSALGGAGRHVLFQTYQGVKKRLIEGAPAAAANVIGGGMKRRRASSSSSSIVSTRGAPIQNGRYRTSGYYGRYVPKYNARGYPQRQDQKFHESFGLTNITGSAIEWQLPSLNLVPQGVTEKTRIGRQIFIKSVHVRMFIRQDTFNFAASAAWSVQPCRVLLYLDRQCNGAAAAASDILEVNAGTPPPAFAFNNLANNKRFRVLRDKFFSPGPFTAADTATQELIMPIGRYVHWRLRFRRGLPIEFDNTTGAITEIKSNNIGLFVWRYAGGTNSYPNLTMETNFRIRFYG